MVSKTSYTLTDAALSPHLYVYIFAEANVQAEVLARTVGTHVPNLQHDIGAK